MKKKRLENQLVKEYYRDCGKGLKERDWRILWGKIRGFPSFLYQTKRVEDTKEEIVNLGLEGKILDAGCGSGYLLSFLPSGSVGIDINPRHIAAAKKNAPRAKVIQGDIERIPFPGNYFSAVLATEIFEHIPDPRRTISEIWRVLGPGGYLLITVPRESLLWRLRFLASSMSRTEPQCLTFTRESLLAIFNNCRYKIKKIGKIAYGLNFLLILQKN